MLISPSRPFVVGFHERKGVILPRRGVVPRCQATTLIKSPSLIQCGPSYSFIHLAHLAPSLLQPNQTFAGRTSKGHPPGELLMTGSSEAHHLPWWVVLRKRFVEFVECFVEFRTDV